MSSYIHHSMERFVEKQWFGIYEFLKKETKRRWSFSAIVGHSRIRVFEMAARLMVQFEDRSDPTSYVCYITYDKDEKGQGFGIQSYNGTYNNHDEMIREIMLGFQLHGTEMLTYTEKQVVG